MKSIEPKSNDLKFSSIQCNNFENESQSRNFKYKKSIKNQATCSKKFKISSNYKIIDKNFKKNIKIRLIGTKNIFKSYTNTTCTFLSENISVGKIKRKKISYKKNESLINLQIKNTDFKLEKIEPEKSLQELDEYWTDENFVDDNYKIDFTRFQSPNLYLEKRSSVCESPVDLVSIQEKSFLNVPEYLADNLNYLDFDDKNNDTFYLQQINEVNVDGFEWDLV